MKSSRQQQAGGPDMFHGVVYQMLWSLLRLGEISIEDIDKSKDQRGPRQAIILEPSGADLEEVEPDGSVLTEIKSKRSGKPWSLKEVIEEIIPNLFARYRESISQGEELVACRFVTEGRLGPWQQEIYEGCFRSLAGRKRGQDPASMFDDESDLEYLSSRARGLGTQVREVSGSISERGLFHYLVDYLRTKLQLREGRNETQKMLLSFLSVFEIVPEKSLDEVWELIQKDLLDLGVKVERIDHKIYELCGGLLDAARNGNHRLNKEDFLRKHGLDSVHLSEWEQIVEKDRQYICSALEPKGYRHELDVRESSPVTTALLYSEDQNSISAADREVARPIVLYGQSGQGKSWLLYRTACELVDARNVVVLVDSEENVISDRREAAKLFCHRLWERDDPLDLNRLATRIRRITDFEEGETWLHVLIDGVQDADYVEELLSREWAVLGIQLVIALTTGAEDDPRERFGEKSRYTRVRDFSPPEVIAFLRERDLSIPPTDVRRLLRRPLLANLYAELAAEQADWQPSNEYQVIEKYWRQQSEGVLMLCGRLTDWASRRLDGEQYPWPLALLDHRGLTDSKLKRLLKTRLVELADHREKLRIWHDRLFEWALAKGLVRRRSNGELTREELWEKLEQCGDRDADHRFGYVLLDTLWLMCGSCERDAIWLLEKLEEARRGQGNYDGLATLGARIVPIIVERLEELDEGWRHTTIKYVAVLEKIEAPEVGDHAERLLNKQDLRLQRIAVRLLKTHGSERVLDRLWSIYKAWSEQARQQPESQLGSSSSRREVAGIREKVEANEALHHCVRDAPEWLERQIHQADKANEPVHTLINLIRYTRADSQLWERVRDIAFEKVRDDKQRCLVECMENFRDRTRLDWLHDQVDREEDRIGASSRRALSVLAPTGKIPPIKTDGVSTFRTAPSWWLPRWQLERPDGVEQLLVEVFNAAEDPWAASWLFVSRENKVPGEVLEMLLDATVTRLQIELETPCDDDHRDDLYRPLTFLAKIGRLELLKRFWQRAGTDLERYLVAWLVREGPNDTGCVRPSEKAGRNVLRKIGGSKAVCVAKTYLEAGETFSSRGEGLELARRFTDPTAVDIVIRHAYREEDDSSLGSTDNDLAEQRAALARISHQM